MVRLDRRGALSLPLAFALVAVVTAGAGFWGILRQWRKNVETQLRLDRCVGQIAQELKDDLGSLDSSNLRLKLERATCEATTAVPAARAAAQAVIVAEFAYQTWIQLKWDVVKAGTMIASQGCGDRRDLPLAWPVVILKRPGAGADDCGALPFEWDEGQHFNIQFVSWPRAAAARVEQGETGEFNVGKNSWQARWARPGPGTIQTF